MVALSTGTLITCFAPALALL